MKKNEEICTNADHRKEPAAPQCHNYLKPKKPYSPSPETEVQLFARIKKSSPYYHQGLNHNGTPQLFKVEGIRLGLLCFRLNDNNYSSHDLAFYVRDARGDFIPLAGGGTHG